LSNLKGIYLNNRDETRALAAVERLQILRPGDAEERRDRGFILARMGRDAEARAELLDYLDHTPGASDAPRVRLLLEQLKGDA